MNGVVTVNKPTGIPSNGVLNRLKRITGISKMGFLGTLDPLAEGVLPVFVGKATKLIASFGALDKRYRVTLRLGERTDTLDSEGTVVETRDASHLEEGAVREVVLSFQGTIEQRTPAFSAVKHGGVPSYKLARQGKPVPEKPRTVRLWETALVAMALPEVTFEVSCSSGTYMRALVEDIGQALEVGAVMTRLVRLSCGERFLLENAHTLAEIEAAEERGERGYIENPADILDGYYPYTVATTEEALICDGRTLPLAPDRIPPGWSQQTEPRHIKALRPDSTLIAIGEAVPLPGGKWGFQPSKVLV